MERAVRMFVMFVTEGGEDTADDGCGHGKDGCCDRHKQQTYCDQYTTLACCAVNRDRPA